MATERTNDDDDDDDGDLRPGCQLYTVFAARLALVTQRRVLVNSVNKEQITPTEFLA